jgi:hypothetical protein
VIGQILLPPRNRVCFAQCGNFNLGEANLVDQISNKLRVNTLRRHRWSFGRRTWRQNSVKHTAISEPSILVKGELVP